MKYNFFKIFKHKVQNGINELISTKDKIEEIRHQYNEYTEKFIKSAENSLVLCAQLKQKYEGLAAKEADSKKSYESLIAANKLNEAKAKYIIYKGIVSAKDCVKHSLDNTEKQCDNIRTTLKNIETNRALIDAKLMTLEVQIDAANICKQCDVGDFGIDCNGMIAEIEEEINATKFRIDAKQEISELIHSNKNNELSVMSNIDSEFDEVVKSFADSV